MKKLNKLKGLIVYDSSCLMCNNFIINIDKMLPNGMNSLYITDNIEKIRNSKNLNSQYKNLDFKNIQKLSSDSIIFIDDKKYYIRSKAILKIFEISKFQIKKICKFLYDNDFLIFLLDGIYRLIAKNRIFISKFLTNKKCQLNFRNLKVL